ncbi:MAG: DUF4167 domain-containing protein [Amaricoccus sp.]
MRPSNKSRSRNKPGNNGHSNGGNNLNNNPRRSMGNIVNRVFESAGPDGKVRGTPQQIIDKYQALARDAQVAGDRVAAENYLQHSEHYSRLLGEAQRSQNEQRFSPDRDDQPQPMRAEEAPARPAAPVMQPAVGSGLTTIEPEDSDYFGGPIETPENSRSIERIVEQPAPAAFQSAVEEPYLAPSPEVVPVDSAPLAAEPSAAADEQPAVTVEASPEVPATPAKRPRVRRKAKVEPEAAPAEPQPAEQVEPAPDQGSF